MAGTKKLTAAQAQALALIAAGGVRRVEWKYPFRVLAPDDTRIADVTVRVCC
jgi:hypothetical protein